jgi:hypothetical protein
VELDGEHVNILGTYDVYKLPAKIRRVNGIYIKNVTFTMWTKNPTNWTFTS